MEFSMSILPYSTSGLFDRPVDEPQMIRFPALYCSFQKRAFSLAVSMFRERWDLGAPGLEREGESRDQKLVMSFIVHYCIFETSITWVLLV